MPTIKRWGRTGRAAAAALALGLVPRALQAQLPPGVDINQLLKQAGGGGGGGGAGGGGGEGGNPALKAPATSAATDLITVSADIVEISGSIRDQVGFSWSDSLEFGETAIPVPGILAFGDINRKTLLGAKLIMLQNEGKAQLLSNPKVIVKSGEQANFVVGGEQPFPVVGPTGGVGVDFKKFGVILNVLPVLLQDDKDGIAAQLQFEISNTDLSNPILVNGTAVPSIVTRQLQTTVEVKAGDTLVLGGLKSSERGVATRRVPFFGRIPLIGWLFTSKDVIEKTTSLYLFVTLDKVR